MTWINLICVIINTLMAVWAFSSYKKAKKNDERFWSTTFFILGGLNVGSAILSLIVFIRFI